MLTAMFPAQTQKRLPQALSRMSIANLAIGFNTPLGARSESSDGIEKAQRLPPHAPRNVYSVDDFNEVVTTEWPRSAQGVGAENVASYFAGVKAGQGMWFDFNHMNDDTHHIAIVPSIQGVNPVTGLAGALGMEQYAACPVHKTPFADGHYCSACGYKWSKQNYVATTGTPRGMFWLDGFRQSDGRVRQWLFTEDSARGVATHVLGDARQYAVAFAIYRSVQAKPVRPHYPVFRGGGNYESDLIGSGGMRSMSFSAKSAAPKMEVAAGALINQLVYDDPQSLDFWNQTPVGIIVLSYADDAAIAEIVQASGLSHNEGPLKGIPVGNYT